MNHMWLKLFVWEEKKKKQELWRCSVNGGEEEEEEEGENASVRRGEVRKPLLDNTSG